MLLSAQSGIKALGLTCIPSISNTRERYEYLYIEDEKGLLELVQMGAIEIHPWGAEDRLIDYPDRLIFDLDPGPMSPSKGSNWLRRIFVSG